MKKSMGGSRLIFVIALLFLCVGAVWADKDSTGTDKGTDKATAVTVKAAEKAVQVIENEERKLDEGYQKKLMENFKALMKENNKPKVDSAVGPGGEK